MVCNLHLLPLIFTARMNVLSKDLICGLVEYINLSPEI